MKYFHLAFLFLMLIFAALQWNDSDAAIWVSIYLVTALLALITFKRICLTCSVAWALVTTLLASYMLIGLAPGIVSFLESNTYTEIFFSMSETKPYIEQAREALGLLIILLYSVGILIHTCLKKK